MIIGIRHRYHVFIWDKANAQRVLQLSYVRLPILISVSVQILRVFVSSNQKS